MIDMETIRFIEMLNELAEKTTHGFMDWNSTNDADTINNFRGILFDSTNKYRVIHAKRIIDEECPHKDVIEYYDQGVIDAHESIIVWVILPEKDDEDVDTHAYVCVLAHDRYNRPILAFNIKNGRWESQLAY